ncbi:MAG: uracil-DNA glycosylase family protein [Gammaproteobacteria bacterium]
MPERAVSNVSPVVFAAKRLGRDVDALDFTTPSHVYNPLRYAWAAHCEYLERYGEKPGRVILLGMNPGPWGMAQTGVPFGDVVMAREWLGIEMPLASPLPAQHPKYPLRGFECHRREGSGSRLWGWAHERFGTPEKFFARFFVWNYCPLLFIGDGRNLTPERLRREEAAPLTAACDRALTALVEALAPTALVGIGRYAERRARENFADRLPIGYLPHPSPASPAANRGWPTLAEEALTPWLD